jgi:ubiquitin-conjugating enzyme E2 O
MEEPAIYIDDICRKRIRGQESYEHLCNVDRTSMDIQTHSRHPAGQYDYPIRRHGKIPQKEFDRFLRHGRPPVGTVLVKWIKIQVPELMPTSELEVAHRFLGLGDTVKKVTREPMTGVVISKEAFYDLAPMCMPSSDAQGLSDDISARSAPFRLTHIPYEELQISEQFIPGDWILYQEWFGTIQDHWDFAYIRCMNGSVVRVGTDILKFNGREMSGYYNIGAQVSWARHSWMHITPVIGTTHPSVPPVGRIVGLKTYKVRVRWHCARLDGGDMKTISQDEPPPLLDSEVLDSGKVTLVNWARTPNKAFPVKNHIEFRMDETVRFRDLTAAITKYASQTPSDCQHASKCKNKLKTLDPSLTFGFDLNVFRVCGGYSRVTVRWEDLTTSIYSPTELYLDQDFESQVIDIYAGQLVIPNPEAEHPTEKSSYRVPRIGVLQEMNALERIAKVHWSTESNVEYLDADWTVKPVPHTAVPIRVPPNGSGQIEEVSLYDIKSAPQICRGLRDVVIIVKPVNGVPSFNGPDGRRDWIGQVVEIKLDGMLVVRTEEKDGSIKDIEVLPEHVHCVMAGSHTESASTEGGDSDDESFEDFSEDEFLDDVQPIDKWVENEKGERIEMDPEEDEEEWSTDDESDMEMADHPAESHSEDDKHNDTAHIRQLEAKHSVTEAEPNLQDAVKMDEKLPTTQSSADDASQKSSDLEIAPPRFDVLETLPPDDHWFITSSDQLASGQIRRVVKEHKMLANGLPEGVFIRTWESRMDILRILLVGPVETPYEYAPFVLDLHLASNFPNSPPEAHFHSWVYDGQGNINPNLYEDGKVCLSLLNT